VANENFPDGRKCPDCARVYGHMKGCKVEHLHSLLDSALVMYKLDYVVESVEELYGNLQRDVNIE
jgi:hypothetical protein